MNGNNNDIFDFDSFSSGGSGGKKPGKKPRNTKQHPKGEHIKQKPPKFVAADDRDKAEAKRPKHLKQDKQDKQQGQPAPPKQTKQERESIENIRRMFDEALNETPEALAELTEAQEIPDEPDFNPEGTRRKVYYFLGIVISLLAIVGLYSTIIFSVDAVKNFADNTQQKNEFAKFVYPIVICDPAPFNQTIKLRSDTMITAAIWDIILYEDKSKYDKEFDIITVPELDVEQHATNLFGTGLSFDHQSIINYDVQFYYDESIKSYRIPENPKYFTYSPYIHDITRVGERYTLTVGYISPTPSWLTLTSDEEPEPDKYVEYVVSKRGSDMTLVAIQESPLKTESEHGL